MFEPGQKIRHVRSGKIVEFVRVSRRHRGVVKIQTTGPWGPIDVEAFEVMPEWTLKTSPQEYLEKYGPDAKNSELARRVLGRV